MTRRGAATEFGLARAPTSAASLAVGSLCWPKQWGGVEVKEWGVGGGGGYNGIWSVALTKRGGRECEEYKEYKEYNSIRDLSILGERTCEYSFIHIQIRRRALSHRARGEQRCARA